MATVTIGAASSAQPRPPKSVSPIVYTADGSLVFPKDYRTWVYVSTGFDMSYDNNGTGMDVPIFDSVFVDPAAYAAYQKTGTWPDKTIFVLETRQGSQKGSINKSGRFQTELLGLEAHVKDVSRFKSGWSFFGYNAKGPSKPTPQNSNCNVCHEQHGAVDTTFVQFYPTLLPTAKAMRTFSAAYLAEEAKDGGDKRQ
ncbi:MAG TPA: cytochrome P460 family protein [Phenylobacterium sp.]|jgi:hypothetical protein